MDDVDLQILDAVADNPLWKSRIHEEIAADRCLSTVQQRVDKLRKHGYLAFSSVHVEELPQLVNVYEPTYEGRQALKQSTGGVQ